MKAFGNLPDLKLMVTTNYSLKHCFISSDPDDTYLYFYSGNSKIVYLKLDTFR